MGHQTKAKIIPNKIAMVTYAITAAEVVLLLAQRWVIFSTLWRTKMKKICPTRRYIISSSLGHAKKSGSVLQFLLKPKI